MSALRLVLFTPGPTWLNVPDDAGEILVVTSDVEFDVLCKLAARALDIPTGMRVQLHQLPSGAKITSMSSIASSDHLVVVPRDGRNRKVLTEAAKLTLQSRPVGTSLPEHIGSPRSSTRRTSVQNVALQELEQAAASRKAAGIRGKALFRKLVWRVIWMGRFQRLLLSSAADTQASRTRKAHGITRSMDNAMKNMFNIYEYTSQRDQLEEDEKLPPFMVHPESLLKATWDIAMLCLVVFFAFAVPYRIGFEIVLSQGESTFDAVADVLFMLDIVVSFRTAYIEDGALVSDQRAVARMYVRSWFFLDVLASLPLGWIVTDVGGEAKLNKLFRMLRLFKLFRILRLLKLFPRVMMMIETAVKLNPAMLRFLRSFLILVMLWHFIACSYYYMARDQYGGEVACEAADGSIGQCYVNLCLCNTNDPTQYIILDETDVTWYNPYVPDLWVPVPQVASWSVSNKYSHAMWWAVQVTTGIGGDILPMSNTEVIYTMVMTVVGLMMYSVIIGSAATALQEMDVGATQRRQKLDEITNYMRARKVPSFFQKIIKDYYSHRWSEPQASQAIFEDLPTKLHSRLQVVLNRDIVERIPAFRLLPLSVYVELVQHMELATFLPGEFVERAGELSDSMYFIKRGKVDAVLEDGFTVYHTYMPGDFFGETPLLHNMPPTNSFRAVDFLDVLVLSRAQLEELQVTAEEFCEHLRMVSLMRLRARLDADRRFTEREKTREQARTNRSSAKRLLNVITQSIRRFPVEHLNRPWVTSAASRRDLGRAPSTVSDEPAGGSMGSMRGIGGWGGAPAKSIRNMELLASRSGRHFAMGEVVGISTRASSVRSTVLQGSLRDITAVHSEDEGAAGGGGGGAGLAPDREGGSGSRSNQSSSNPDSAMADADAADDIVRQATQLLLDSPSYARTQGSAAGQMSVDASPQSASAGLHSRSMSLYVTRPQASVGRASSGMATPIATGWGGARSGAASSRPHTAGPVEYLPGQSGFHRSGDSLDDLFNSDEEKR